MADLLPSSLDPSAGEGGEPRVIGVDSDDADDLLAALQSETARDLLSALYDEPATPSALAEKADTSIQNVRYHLEKLTDADLVEVADTIYSEKGREMKVYVPSAKPLVVFAGGGDDAPGIEAALSRLLGGLGVLGLSSLLVQRIFGRGPFVPDVEFGMGSSGGSAAATTTGNATWQGQQLDATTELGDSAATEATPEATRTASGATPTAAETSRQTTEESVRTAATADAATTVAEPTTTAADAIGGTDTTTVAEAAGAATSGLPPGVLFFAGGVAVLLALTAAWYLRAR